MKSTFAQRFCLTICLLSIVFFGIEFNYVVHNPTCLKDAVTASFLTALTGFIAAAFAKCYTFIVGSTAGSQAKNDLLLNATPPPAAPPIYTGTAAPPADNLFAKNSFTGTKPND